MQSSARTPVLPFLALSFAVHGACATAPERAPSERSEPGVSVVDAAFGRDGFEPSAGRAQGTRLREEELALWNDPGFRRRFTESYVADTETEPGVTIVEREDLQEVLDLIAADRLDDAAKAVEEQVGEASSAVFDFTLGNVRFQQERFDLAAAAYEAAIEKYPSFRRAWRNLGVIAVREGDFESAARALTRVIELGEGDAVTYGLLGYSYANLERHVAAESAYRLANLLEPDYADWKTGLARSFFKQRRYADAIALCGALIEEEPDRADLWMLQANAYVGLGRPLEAAENFEIVDRLGGATAESLETQADIYVNEDLLDLAVDCYGRALELRADRVPERAMRAARVLVAKGAFAETRALVERIEGLCGAALDDEAKKELLHLRARIAVAEGAGEEEARVLREIVALDPLDGDALILLGQHEARAGNPEQAVFYYERAAALEEFEADAKVRHAQLLVGRAKYAEALLLLRRAQALNPRDNVQEYLQQVERAAQARSATP